MVRNSLKWVMGVSLVLLGSSLNAFPNGPAGGEYNLQAVGAEGENSIQVVGTQTIAEEGECTYNEFFIVAIITGTDDDTGDGYDEVEFAVWDDGTKKDFQVVKVPVGKTERFDITLSFKGLYGTSAPGVGIGSYEIEGGYIDPFYPEDVEGSCPKNGIKKCWVEPRRIKAGETVTFYAEIEGTAKQVVLYNGNLPVLKNKKSLKLKDPDGDKIYSVKYKVPSSSKATGPWLFDYKIKATGNWKGDEWCPGIRVR